MNLKNTLILAVCLSIFLSTNIMAQNVGIETADPLMKLHVASGDSAVMLLENTQAQVTGINTGLYFKTGNDTYSYTGALKTIIQQPNFARLGLFTYASQTPGGLLERLSILDDGNVGIGTTTPPNKFSVVGNANFSGSVGFGTNSADASAKVEINSTTKGFLPPRMTMAQRTAISSPATGLLVFQTDTLPGYYYYTGASWIGLVSSESPSLSTGQCIDYDGNAYRTVQIGTQVWMAENLRVAHYRNGDSISNIPGGESWSTLTSGAICYYNNDQSTYGKYGALYNGFAVTDNRGLCPEGWKVPTNADFGTLITYLGGGAVAGGRMKSVSALWSAPNTNATDASGFSILPGGILDPIQPGFTFATYSCWMWTSTSSGVDNLYTRIIYYNNSTANPYVSNKLLGVSVRCIREN